MDRIEANSLKDSIKLDKIAAHSKSVKKTKKKLEECFDIYERAAKKLRRAAIKNRKAEKSLNAKPSEKKQKRCESKKAKLIKRVTAYNAVAEQINALTDQIRDDYQGAKLLMFEVNMNEAISIINKYEKYSKEVGERIEKIESLLEGLEIPVVD